MYMNMEAEFWALEEQMAYEAEQLGLCKNQACFTEWNTKLTTSKATYADLATRKDDAEQTMNDLQSAAMDAETMLGEKQAAAATAGFDENKEYATYEDWVDPNAETEEGSNNGAESTWAPRDAYG